jgi:hypothetical protein
MLSSLAIGRGITYFWSRSCDDEEVIFICRQQYYLDSLTFQKFL